MSTKHPNRVGETGTLTAGDPYFVTLSGTALSELRTFAAAITAGAVAEGDTIGASVRDGADHERWETWTATLGDGVVTRIALEDASTLAIDDEAAVEIRAAITAGSLALAIDEAITARIPPSPYDGPDYWTILSSSPTTWNPTEGYYEHDGTEAGGWEFSLEQTDWAGGYRPSSVSLDLYIPVGASVDSEYINLKIVEVTDDNEIQGDYLSSDYTEGSWKTLSCDLSALVSDIASLRLDSMAGSTYYIKNILFAE